jgi:hypothetical protein
MVESNSELLARVDERTKSIVEKIDGLATIVNGCIKPELQTSKVDIAVLQAHERVVIGVLAVIVPVVLTVALTIIWELVK